MTNAKINDMQDQRIVQTGEKPNYYHAKRTWNTLRLQVPKGISTKVLDNYFTDEKKANPR